ncbi:DUF1810 domain-containing protein [Jatrophihabitans sp. DSM 45814]
MVPSGSRASDPYRLQRFLDAQDRNATFERAVQELQAGLKTSHWMWFVFPQIAGLGYSAMSREYAISSLAEARAYLEHPVLAARLLECAQIVASTQARSAAEIFGEVDAQKLHSSMTLFSQAADPTQEVFGQVLDRYFAGSHDGRTDEMLDQLGT